MLILWVGSSCWISTKAGHKGTLTSTCWLDICWATHCLRHSLLMLNGCWFVWIVTFRVLVTMHLAVLCKSQECLNLKALKYRFCYQNDSLIFLAGHCFEQLSKIASRRHFSLQNIISFSIFDQLLLLYFRTYEERLNSSSFSRGACQYFVFKQLELRAYTLHHFPFLLLWKET